MGGFESDGLGGSVGPGLAWEGSGAGAGVLRLEPDFLRLGFAVCDWKLNQFGFCDCDLVLGWVGLEIEGLGRSTEAMTSNFYLFLS